MHLRILKFSNFIISIIFALLLSLNNQAQTRNSEFYTHEEKNWIERITRSKAIEVDTTFDALFYHLKISVAVDYQYIQGSVICRFKGEVPNLESISLDLYKEFLIDSIRGNSSSYTFENNKIKINLDKTFLLGEVGEVEIFYKGVPVLAGGYKGLRYETHIDYQPIIATLSTPFLAHYWWPCKDGPGDKPDSVFVDIAIPDTVINGIPLTAVSNGVLEETKIEGSSKIFKWRERYPIVPYYVMVAISNYRHFQQSYVGANGVNFPIDYYVFSQSLNQAQQGVEKIPNVISFFSEKFGEYPFKNEKYGMTELGYYGAIENQTNTIQNSLSPDWFNISVHELSHMWFGDMITCKTWKDGWLNEGFATYSEALWAENEGGEQAYKNEIKKNRYYLGNTLHLSNDTDPFGIFISIIYKKGAYVLHMLRGVLGDEVFFRAMKEYATTPDIMYDHATTEDFKLVCEEVSGTDLDYFFDQWVYDQYYPIYDLEFVKSESEFDAQLTIKQIQVNYGLRPIFKMPVQIKIKFKDGSDTLFTIMNDMIEQRYNFSFSKMVSDMEFDPDYWLLRKNVTITDVENENQQALTKFSLVQNYPNPFNPATKIKITIGSEIQKTEKTKLSVFDIIGNEVAVLVNDYLVPGEYEFNFNGKNLVSGVYFCRLKSSKFSSVKKMVLVK